MKKKVRKYQKGSFVDSTLLANTHLNFVQRILDPNRKVMKIPGGEKTHLMSHGPHKGSWYVWPRVVEKDGKLVDLGDRAFDYAMETGEYIRMPNETQAEDFAVNYKKNNIAKFQQGGLLDLFGGGAFAGLFPENTYDFDYDQTIDWEDEDIDAQELYDNFYEKDLAGRRGFGKKKRARKRAAQHMEELKEDPDFINQVMQRRRQGAVTDYLQSDYFSQGMQGFMGQMKDYQDQVANEKRAFEIDAYTVNPDQGFALSFQDGGFVGDIDPETIKYSKKGYRDGSPDIDEPALKIKGNNITMRGVGKSLLLVPDQGEPVYAAANSGEYFFPGATEVTEYVVPEMKEGGFTYDKGGPTDPAKHQEYFVQYTKYMTPDERDTLSRASKQTGIPEHMIWSNLLAEGGDLYLKDRATGKDIWKAADENYISGFKYFGTDTLGPYLQSYQEKGWLPESVDYSVSKNENEKGQMVTTANPKSFSDAIWMNAAHLKSLKTKIGKKDLSPEQEEFFTYVAYNAGLGNANKMIDSYRRDGLLESDAFLKDKEQNNWNQPFTYAKRRYSKGKTLASDYFEAHRPKEELASVESKGAGVYRKAEQPDLPTPTLRSGPMGPRQTMDDVLAEMIEARQIEEPAKLERDRGFKPDYSGLTKGPHIEEFVSHRGDPFKYRKKGKEYQYFDTRDENASWITAKGSGLEAIKNRYEPMAREKNRVRNRQEGGPAGPPVGALLPREAEEKNPYANDLKWREKEYRRNADSYNWLYNHAETYNPLQKMFYGDPIERHAPGFREDMVSSEKRLRIARMKYHEYEKNKKKEESFEEYLTRQNKAHTEAKAWWEDRKQKYQMGGFQIGEMMPAVTAKMLMQMGGQTEQQGPEPVQLEKGEEIIFQDGTIVPAKANKRHSQMKDYEVTDVLPPSYIASRDKTQRLDRDHAKGMVVSGMGPVEYSENEQTPLPEQKTLGDLFRKKNETPAAIARRIRNKFPVTDHDDIYAEATKAENLQSRAPYTDALISLAESKRNELDDGTRKYGGWTPRKMQGGGGGGLDLFGIGSAIQGIGQIATGAMQFALAKKAQKRTEANEAQSLQEIGQFEQNALNRNQIAAGIGATSVLGQYASQDTSYTNLNLDAQRNRLSNALTLAGQNIGLRNRQAGHEQQAPLYSMAKFASLQDPRQGQQAYRAGYSNYLTAANQRELKNVDMETDLALKGAEGLGSIDKAEAVDIQAGDMYEKSTTNLLNQGLFAGMGSVGESFLQNQDKIEGATMSARMAARNQTTSALNNITQSYSDAAGRMFHGVGDVFKGVGHMRNSAIDDAGDFSYSGSNGYEVAGTTTFQGDRVGDYRWNGSTYVYDPQ